jgi:hypothetical protein
MTLYSEALPSSPAKGRVMLARYGDRRLAVAIALYLVVLGSLAAWRWHIGTYGADTGLFTQVVSDGLGGFRDGPEDGTHFRFHWSPLLALLWPLVAAPHLSLVLQFVQVALIAATAIPLYLLARTYLPEKLGLAVACLALVYPPLMAVAFTEFHEIAFYPPIAVGLFWAADRAAWRWFAVFACASALIREDTCIVFAIVGLIFAAIGVLRRGTQIVGDDGLLVGRPRQPRALALAGVALALVNVAAPLAYFGLVIPRVGAWEPSHFYDYPFASSPLGLLAALFAHPAYVAYLLVRAAGAVAVLFALVVARATRTRYRALVEQLDCVAHGLPLCGDFRAVAVHRRVGGAGALAPRWAHSPRAPFPDRRVCYLRLGARRVQPAASAALYPADLP